MKLCVYIFKKKLRDGKGRGWDGIKEDIPWGFWFWALEGRVQLNSIVEPFFYYWSWMEWPLVKGKKGGSFEEKGNGHGSYSEILEGRWRKRVGSCYLFIQIWERRSGGHQQGNNNNVKMTQWEREREYTVCLVSPFSFLMIFPLFDKSKDVLPKRVKYLISDFWYILLILFFTDMRRY